MHVQDGFTLMSGPNEIKSFLNSQKITRQITKIQIHHMAMPNYNTWEVTDKKKWAQPHIGRTNSLNEYGKTTWGSKDDKGKYIAQHFNIFPDGKITSGRSLNSTPIGIRNWNANAICIEIYGDFDRGRDVMYDVQKKAIIELVGELCKHFKIATSDINIRYHAWFDSAGSYLGNYIPGKSTKTCPGTSFFGGNTIVAYRQNFLPAIKDYISGVKEYKVRVTASVLNIRSKADATSTRVGSIKKGEVYTIVKTSGSWGYLKSGVGWIHLGYTEKL